MQELGFDQVVYDLKPKQRRQLIVVCPLHCLQFCATSHPPKPPEDLTVKAAMSIAKDHMRQYGCRVMLVTPI
ncbi:hypothetical protein A2Z22_01690 [Candidatus Woesebacteria bacterium RBG_16_34_12]|uniref:Uncharacterized protein n=1 Tax=Candidatus Woesebacteria bacterium RBG_16_34_12 TaxID=1802480 RepID=A0A1F7XA67_9BACT|nr:MAG: hypothetical protein A2Z22_01690 [Candidatus Woesebacteria bacterium RBG_16_34_12]